MAGGGTQPRFHAGVLAIGRNSFGNCGRGSLSREAEGAGLTKVEPSWQPSFVGQFAAGGVSGGWGWAAFPESSEAFPGNQ